MHTKSWYTGDPRDWAGAVHADGNLDNYQCLPWRGSEAAIKHQLRAAIEWADLFAATPDSLSAG